MKLTVFQSDKGDCLLVTAEDGTRMLADGGMAGSYSAHVAPTLGEIRKAGGGLDVVYVSHIDQDHISGVLQLMRDELAWRVRDYQRNSGNEAYPEPEAPRPPEVGEVWHNAFHEEIGENAGPVEELLAQTAAVLAADVVPGDHELSLTRGELATSIGEGIELSRRIAPEQLGIPVNAAFGGRLAMVRDEPQEIQLGELMITLVGPHAGDLEALRDEWNEWLRENQATLERIRERTRAEVAALGAPELDLLRRAIALQAEELGDRSKVTLPNLASLMLLVEEGDKTVLLTGDGHQDDVLQGLERAGKLDHDGGIHVDVLKLQHHGSENNIDADFCRRVTAAHYVICANGAHENPDLRAIEEILASRLGPAPRLSPNEQAGEPFSLWFNSSPAATPVAANKAHMEAVERLVSARARESDGRFAFAFLEDGSFELRL